LSDGSQYMDVSQYSKWTLYVDAKSKTLSWDLTHERAEKEAYHVVNSWNLHLREMLEIVENPPVPPEEFTSIKGLDGTIVNVYDNGNVEFVSYDQVLCKANADVIKGIAKQLGLLNDKKGLPLVKFYYPSSTSGSNLRRIVRVTRMDGTHIQGFEIPHACSEEEGTFKKFSISKISGPVPALPVNLLEFIQE